MRLTRRHLLAGGLATGSALLLPGLPGRAAAAGLPSLRPNGPSRVSEGFLALSGSLHDHSTDSDGDSSSEAISMWVAAHRQELGIDYAIFTDHSDFFPVSYYRIEQNPAAATDTACWIRQTALDAENTFSDFVYLRGFEWTNDQENHMNFFFTANWTSRAVTGDAALSMSPLWEWFNTMPVAADPTGEGLIFGGADGIGQFNHPGDKGALNWDNYQLNANAVARMVTIEIHGDQGKASRGNSDGGWYWFALSQGWHVSPVMNWDYHVWTGNNVLQTDTPGVDYGTTDYLPGQRTVIFATAPTSAAMRTALQARRTCASEVPDSWAVLRGPAGEFMGGTIAASPGQTLTVTVEAEAPTEGLRSVEIVGSGVSPSPYYYGDNQTRALDDFDKTDNLTPGYDAQHAKYLGSPTTTTLKSVGGTGPRFDAPPPGATLASTTFTGTGTRQTVPVTVTIPSTASPRPDGLHFLYAIVHTGPPNNDARVWTAPLLVAPAVTAALPESSKALLLPAAGLVVAGVTVAAARRRAGNTSDQFAG